MGLGRSLGLFGGTCLLVAAGGYFWHQGRELDADGARVEGFLSRQGVHAIGGWAADRCAQVNLAVRATTDRELAAVGRPSGAAAHEFVGRRQATARDVRVDEGRGIHLAVGAVGVTPNMGSLAVKICRTDGGDAERFSFTATVVTDPSPMHGGPEAEWVLLAQKQAPPASPSATPGN